MEQLLKEIFAKHELQFKSSHTVSGGDISTAFAVETNQGLFFIKLNSATMFPLMFKREAEGLAALKGAAPLLKIPDVTAEGELNLHQYLVMNWVEKTKPSASFWHSFAEGLAQLHRNTNVQFGWHSSNCIGSLVQQNTFTPMWSEFYASQRILPLVEALFNVNSFSISDVQSAESLCSRLEQLFPAEQPAMVRPATRRWCR